MANESTLPKQKDAYAYCADTRELMGTVKVFLSPDGVYYLPDAVTEVAPVGNTAQFQAFRLKDDGTAWEPVSDYRRVMLYGTDTATPIANVLKLGDALPVDVTTAAPVMYGAEEPKYNVWDAKAQAWVEAPDFSRFTVYSKEDGSRSFQVAKGHPLPSELTTVEPPLLTQPHQAAQFNDETSTWSSVVDHRGDAYWTADGEQHVIDKVGVEPPADSLPHPPTAADAN